jgi:hypothetical protein
MDAFTYIAKNGVPASAKEFLATIKFLKRSAWNAFPSRHYFGMVTVEQTDGGWNVGFAPAESGGETSTVFYRFEDERTLALDVGRKMHPTLICVCASPDACFAGTCPVRP